MTLFGQEGGAGWSYRKADWEKVSIFEDKQILDYGIVSEGPPAH